MRYANVPMNNDFNRFIELGRVLPAEPIRKPQTLTRTDYDADDVTKLPRMICYPSKMYEEARPMARKLNAYVNNSIDDISIFSEIERTISALYLARDKAVAICDNKLLADVQKANEQKKSDQLAEIEEERFKREEAFEMLSSF